MIKFERQHNLFKKSDLNFSENIPLQDIFINQKIIKEWQEKIISHQSIIFKYGNKNINQYSLFESISEELNEPINPLKLTPLPLSFWRWPKAMHEGPAVYFVMDKIIDSDENIILYIGETISAEKRWKGEHDCKNYLSSYSDYLQKANISTNLNIRFWLDVPIKTKERRKLEQQLIQTWLPPFNKETREIWSTPFTSQIS
ncbi:GIY-YIG nuclease family protein [Prochlorococcus marinus]|uniref:GIY-YIG nuclease family protein n=1 Tax=Prochlorococcus marinus TaxID=1219 RepID=UPI0022B3F463|nr:GIY-YIG nuclease family protein [Prochlorococcus marinus]